MRRIQQRDHRALDNLVLQRGQHRIELHFDPDSLWDRLKLLTRFIPSAVRSLSSSSCEQFPAFQH
jgi:hypothetical protein